MSSSADQSPSPPHPTGLLLVISGPSGVGKTTITRAVVERLDAVFSVSATTRPTTPADVPGRDYHFVDSETFERMIAGDELLEHARVYDEWYGTPRQPVLDALDAGRIVLLEIDVQGAMQIRRALPEAFMVFVLPPDDAALLERLRRRRREDEARIQRRFREAQDEIVLAHESGVYDLFVVNRDVDTCVEEVCRAVRTRLSGGAG
jgi:guanylate kinase